MIRYDLAAVDELEDAANYLDAQRPGYGRELVLQVQATFERMEAQPASFERIRDRHGREIRRARVFGFSYDIIFQVCDGSILRIVAFAHHSRKAGYWRKRL